MLLLHPPATKPCEPPAGIARLLGALRNAGVSCSGADLNLHVYLSLFDPPSLRNVPFPDDTWTRRAVKNRDRNFNLLRNAAGYSNSARYIRAVEDLNRLLLRPAKGDAEGDGGCGNSKDKVVRGDGAALSEVRLSLSDYSDPRRSPLRSEDLVESFLRPRENPLFYYFRLPLEDLLEEKSPRAVGISLSFLSQALPAFAIAGFIRNAAPGIKIVLGGSLLTSWIRLPGFRNPFEGLFDLLVEGPGEGPLLDYARKAVTFTGTEDELPGTELSGEPDYGDFQGLPYLAPGFILPYAASRGCSWKRCTFCPEGTEDAPYRQIPPDRVLRELKSLIGRTNPVLVHFLDSEMSPSLLRALAESPPGVPWYGFARITREMEDWDFCRSLRRAGCVMLKLGIESGDPAVLDAMNKGITVESASRALRSLKGAGIETYVYLLFGTPAEGTEEAERTLDFTARHADCIGFLNLAIFNLPRGSRLAEGLETADFSEGDLSFYREFVHPKGWNRREVREFLEKRFKKHPAVAPILRRIPPYFGSNHAPFFGTL